MSANTTAEAGPNRTGNRAATVAGTIIAILGVLAVLFPFITGISLSILLGAVLVLGALVHASNAFSAGNIGTVLGQVILAVLYGFAGIAFISNPVLGLATLTLLVIGFFLADGVVEIAWGLRSRGQPGAMWLFTSGGVSLLLAVLLWLELPTSAGWAVGLLLGVNLIVTGLSMAIIGRERRGTAGQEVPQESQG
jgi:uncharacterized membrane protein HdeD (DUF308 family)